MNKEFKILLGLITAFAGLYYLPIEHLRFQEAIIESFKLVKWYAREHVLLCLLPAFFIAGAIGVFVSQNAVMKYFGPKANKLLSYGVASVSGAVLAVCSCTVLPLFGSIYMRGAGLGPAIAFLYSGPAINVLAIVLTARILGAELGIARAVGAVLFSVIIGGIMHFIYRKEEHAKAQEAQEVYIESDDKPERPLWQTVIYFFSMSAILLFANWGKPVDSTGLWHTLFSIKWELTAFFAIILGAALWKFLGVKYWRIILGSIPVIVTALLFPNQPVAAFTAGAVVLALLTLNSTPEMNDWRDQTWGFAKQISPLLMYGVLAAGFFLGSPETKAEGIIPNAWIQALVGGNSFRANFLSSLIGAFMYFATLTEVPIVRGLMDSGMGRGPALALLLAGPALSLPSMLVINSILGLKKTVAYVSLVVTMATITGIIFGIYTG